MPSLVMKPLFMRNLSQVLNTSASLLSWIMNFVHSGHMTTFRRMRTEVYGYLSFFEKSSPRGLM